MKKLIEDWRSFLTEKKADPTYSQETFNAFILLAISNERGGNRDEIKNDIRAIEEVLTVTPVERVDGGVQKDVGDYFLSTIKLRIRLPRGVDREWLTQEVVKDVNTMRGLTVRSYNTERSRELREDEMNYSGTLPKDQAEHERMKKRLLGFGGISTSSGGSPFTEKPSYKHPKATSEGRSEETKE